MRKVTSCVATMHNALQCIIRFLMQICKSLFVLEQSCFPQHIELVGIGQPADAPSYSPFHTISYHIIPYPTTSYHTIPPAPPPTLSLPFHTPVQLLNPPPAYTCPGQWAFQIILRSSLIKTFKIYIDFNSIKFNILY